MRRTALPRPTIEQIQAELKRLKSRNQYVHLLSTTIFSLMSAAAAAVLICVLLMPILRIYGSSMEPTLHDGEIVISLKNAQPDPGDLIGFYYNNKILVKRVIAVSGDWVNIDPAGNVSVNDIPLDEPYVMEKALGECDISLPYQVPEGRIFVMGDHRLTSVDSRSTSVGCTAEEQIVGQIVFCIWPPRDFGFVK